MTDNEFTLFAILALVALYAVYLKLSVRKLRARIESYAASAAAGSRIAEQAPPSPQPSPEIEQLRARVQVLERIATDGNPALVEDIEALRRA